MHHVLEVVVPGWGSWARCLGPVGWLHTFEMVTEHFANPNSSVVVAKCWFLGFVVCWVNHLGILYKLCSVGIGDSVLSILTQLVSNRSQQVMVDGCQSELVNVVSRVPQVSDLGPLLFLLYTSELFSILENKLIGYADDSTLVAVLPSPGIRVAVAESLMSDLGRVS